MRILGKKDSADDQPPSEGEALEKRIDAMMQPERSKPADPPPPQDKPDSAPAIDIFKATSTAPPLPKTVATKIEINQPAESAKPEPPSAVPDPSTSTPPATPELDDSATDKAVDEIAAQESDELLAHQDAANQKGSGAVVSKVPFKQRLVQLLRNKWTWIIVGVIVVAVFGVPYSRYRLLGLVIQKPFVVTVVDSKTNTPVSSAQITVAGHQAKTDASGKARLSAPVGSDELQISKQYYKNYQQKVFVGLSGTGSITIKLDATGRQVPVKVLNSITGKPLADATISVLNTTAKTDTQGVATIVLPTTATSDPATISASGYNNKSATVTVTSSVSQLNTFNLTPAGKIYFLSNLSGKIDVVKTNLDGSDRQTVLAGTGKEDPNNTNLLAARDWSFLVLKAQRDSSQASLYLIDTSNDKVTQFDSSSANFTLVGWYGHNFVYDATLANDQQWQSGQEILKSYNADSQTLNQLDQNQAIGTSAAYGYQTFNNFYILDNVVVYTTQWYAANSYDISSKTDTVRAVQPGGQNKKDYQSWPAATIGYIQGELYQPQTVYYAVYTTSDGKTTYYQFNNQAVSTISLDQTSFNQPYPTYLISPSAAQTFWTELRDGKNTLFVGDKNAQHGLQLASLSDYSPYGWYTDNYLLVSKNSSELYVMPVGGLSSNQQPLKITDYYKPATNFTGYGYGYGGL